MKYHAAGSSSGGLGVFNGTPISTTWKRISLASYTLNLGVEALPSVLTINWLAHDLIRQYGRKAELVATAKIKAMHDQHDLDGENMWRGVLRQVDAIQKREFGKQLREDLTRGNQSDEL